MNTELLTVSQVAARLQISDRYTRQLIAKGTLKAVHIGSSLRVRPADLWEFIQSLDNKEKKDGNTGT